MFSTNSKLRSANVGARCYAVRPAKTRRAKKRKEKTGANRATDNEQTLDGFFSFEDDDDFGAMKISKKSRKRKIAIVGGLGRVGKILTKKIIENNDDSDSNNNNDLIVFTRDLGSKESEDIKEYFSSKFSSATTRDADAPVYDLREMDVAKATEEEMIEKLKDCDVVVGCFGAQRMSTAFDSMTRQEDRDLKHPKFVNFLAVKKLARASRKVGCKRFVRVTGMSVGYSAFDFIAVLLNTVLSMTIKFQLLGELAIREECEGEEVENEKGGREMSYTIVRPGNLTDVSGIADQSTSTSTNDNRNNNRVVVLTHGTNHIDASKVSREDVAELLYKIIEKNENETKNCTISIAGGLKATAGTRSAMRWDPARGAYWETQAIDDENVQILSSWNDIDCSKFERDRRGDLKEKKHDFWAWSFLIFAYAFAYLFIRAVISLAKLLFVAFVRDFSGF